MTLNELHKTYKAVADTLFFYLKDSFDNTYKYVGFAELTKNNGAVLKSERYGLTRPQLAQLIANMYCDAEEIIILKKEENLTKAENQRDKCFSAWMCLYWSKTSKWKSSSASLKLDETDFAQVWLEHCIDACLYYRSWRPIRIDHQHKKKTGESIYIENPQYKPNEVNSVDKSMNHWIACERARRYQEANKDKRKLNQMTVSFNIFKDEDGESTLDRNPLLAEEGFKYNPIDEITTMLTRKGKLLEALVIEALAYGTAVKQVKDKETATLTQTLNLRGVSKYIKGMTSREVSSFANKFEVNEKDILMIINKLSPKKVSDAFEIAKATLLQNKDEVYSMLCNN